MKRRLVAIKNAYPDKGFDDLMRGVDEVISKGYIDERNLFVYGGSGGGVLTAWIVGHTDRFAAASSNYPVIMLRFNEEWHGTSSKPSNYMRSVLYLRSWFERYMTKDELVTKVD